MSNSLKFIILILFVSCVSKKKEIFNHEFQIEFSPFATVRDVAISENEVFILTNKHELLSYTFDGNKTLDTVILKPKLYPDKSVEYYPNNAFRSLFYYDNSCYFLGQNPSDLYRFDQRTKKISKKMVKLEEAGLHYILHSEGQEAIIRVNNIMVTEDDLILYRLDLNSMKPKKIIKESLGYSQEGSYLYHKDNILRILNPLQNGYLEVSESGKLSKIDGYFLDSILDKSKPKRVMELSEFYGKEPWERNQYLPDLILSAISVDRETDYFLIKKLNRTSPKEKDFKILIIKKSQDNIEIKELENFVFCKFDLNTNTFCGVTVDSNIMVTSDLDRIMFGENPSN
jgi:hypothetical protein